MRALILLSMAFLSLAGCASAPPAEPAGSCQPLVGRYVDAGTPQLRDLTEPGERGPRAESLAELVGIDTDVLDGIPAAERVLTIRRTDSDYRLGVERRDAPPTDTAVWEIAARCERDELRFETRARYASADGTHVTREQVRLSAYADEDGTLIVERVFRRRALGLVDVRRGGGREQYFRFAPLR